MDTLPEIPDLDEEHHKENGICKLKDIPNGTFCQVRDGIFFKRDEQLRTGWSSNFVVIKSPTEGFFVGNIGVGVIITLSNDLRARQLDVDFFTKLGECIYRTWNTKTDN